MLREVMRGQEMGRDGQEMGKDGYWQLGMVKNG